MVSIMTSIFRMRFIARHVAILKLLEKVCQKISGLSQKKCPRCGAGMYEGAPPFCDEDQSQVYLYCRECTHLEKKT